MLFKVKDHFIRLPPNVNPPQLAVEAVSSPSINFTLSTPEGGYELYGRGYNKGMKTNVVDITHAPQG